MSTEKPSRNIDAPPEIPTLVRCTCCSEEYDSYLLVWVPASNASQSNQSSGGKWCCPTEGCNGHGFGHHINPLEDGELEEPDFSHDSMEMHVEFEPELDEEFEAEMAAWESLEPEFSSLLGCDIDYKSLRVDGLLDDPTAPQRFDFDDVSDEDIPF